MKVNKKYFFRTLIYIVFVFFSGLLLYSIDAYNSAKHEIVQNYDADKKTYYYFNEKTNYSAMIDDSANLLSKKEKKKLLNEMTSLTKHGYIALVSTDSNSSSVENFADNYYQSHFDKEDGTIFVIDVNNGKIYIFSSGNNAKYITVSKANSIIDSVYKDSVNKNYYSCASFAFNQIQMILDSEKIDEPIHYIGNIFIALTLAFFISFIYILFKSRISAASYDEIIDNCDIQFKINNSYVKKIGSRKVRCRTGSTSDDDRLDS